MSKIINFIRFMQPKWMFRGRCSCKDPIYDKILTLWGAVPPAFWMKPRIVWNCLARHIVCFLDVDLLLKYQFVSMCNLKRHSVDTSRYTSKYIHTYMHMMWTHLNPVGYTIAIMYIHFDMAVFTATLSNILGEFSE